MHSHRQYCHTKPVTVYFASKQLLGFAEPSTAIDGSRIHKQSARLIRKIHKDKTGLFVIASGRLWFCGPGLSVKMGIRVNENPSLHLIRHTSDNAVRFLLETRSLPLSCHPHNNSYYITQYTQNICITFIQCWTNVEDVGPTLY